MRLNLHHEFPSGRMILLGVESEVRTRKRCINCQFLRREHGRFYCTKHEYYLTAEVVRQPFPCEDYKRKKDGRKRRKK